jgi:hypothetical protein
MSDPFAQATNFSVTSSMATVYWWSAGFSWLSLGMLDGSGGIDTVSEPMIYAYPLLPNRTTMMQL